MDELRAAYDRDGYVHLPGFQTGRDLETFQDNIRRYTQDTVPALPREHVFLEDRNDPSTLKQLQHLEAHDPWFHDQLTSGPFRDLAECLLQGPVVPKNLQYFNKPAGVGRPTPPHQDGFYFMLDPCEAITLWFALDRVDEENGCVRYVRGSHQLGMRPHGRTQTLGFSQGITGFPAAQDQAGEVPCPAQPGDLLAHDAMTIHWAEGNRSAQASRRALGFIYFSARAREDTAAQAAYQQRLAEEMRVQGKI